jgi:hypothetical protein
MDNLEKYGRDILKRIEHLYNGLSDNEKKGRISSFIGLNQYSQGGTFDVNEHSKFFQNVNEYSLREIDKVFYQKYNIHIVKIPQQLGLKNFSENE